MCFKEVLMMTLFTQEFGGLEVYFNGSFARQLVSSLTILRIILSYRRNVVNVTINMPKSSSVRLMKKDIVC